MLLRPRITQERRGGLSNFDLDVRSTSSAGSKEARAATGQPAAALINAREDQHFFATSKT
jgi:hypothetical protein